jgi:hypothetical protein
MKGPTVQDLVKQQRKGKSKKRRRPQPSKFSGIVPSSPFSSSTNLQPASFNPVDEDQDSEEYRRLEQLGGSSILPSLSPSTSNESSFDPSFRKNKLAQLYHRVGITPVEIPQKHRLTKLYYESAGILPSLSATPHKSPKSSQITTKTKHPTTSVSVQPSALEEWLDEWLKTNNNNSGTTEPEAASNESHAVRVLMHLASRSGWKSTRGSTSASPNLLEEKPTILQDSQENTSKNTNENLINAGKTRTYLPFPNKYFLTPMFAHPDDHALFSRKHWRAESADNKREGDNIGVRNSDRPITIGGSTDNILTMKSPVENVWGQLSPDKPPTFEPLTLLDPGEFGLSQQASRIYNITEEINEMKDGPVQQSLRSGILTSTGMYLIRCILYLSGVTEIQINGMTVPSTSGRTSSHRFSPGTTLSGALSTARELNHNSHQSNSHNRVLLEVLEKSRRLWFSRKKKRGSKAGPLLFAALLTFAKPTKKLPLKSRKLLQSYSIEDNCDNKIDEPKDDSKFNKVSQNHTRLSGSRIPNFRGHIPEDGRPHSNSRQNRSSSSKQKSDRPNTTPHGWQPATNNRISSPSPTLKTSSLRVRELLGSTGGTFSEVPEASDMLASGEPSLSINQGINVPSKSMLPGNYFVSPTSKTVALAMEATQRTRLNDQSLETFSLSQSNNKETELFGIGNNVAGHLIELDNTTASQQCNLTNKSLSTPKPALNDRIKDVNNINLNLLHVTGTHVPLAKVYFKDNILYRCCQKIQTNTGSTHYAFVAVIERNHLAVVHRDGHTELLVSVTIALPSNESKTISTVVSGLVLARIMYNNRNLLPLAPPTAEINSKSIASELSHLCMLVEHESEEKWCLSLCVPDKYREDDTDSEYLSQSTGKIRSRPNSRSSNRSRSTSRPGSRDSSRPGSRGSSRPGSRGNSRPGSRGNSRPGSRGGSRPQSRGRSPLRGSRPISREKNLASSHRSDSRPNSRKSHHKKRVSKKRSKLNKKISQLAGKISTLVDRSQPIYIYVSKNNQSSSEEIYTGQKNLYTQGSEISDTKTGDDIVTQVRTRSEIATQTINFKAGDVVPSMESLGGYPGSATYLRQKVIQQCSVCGGELSENEKGKRIGRFDVPVCSSCSPPTPRRDLCFAPIVHETSAVLSGMEVTIRIRSYGAGCSEGIRFEASDVLSENREYHLETNENECLNVLADCKKSDLNISDTFDPVETFNNTSFPSNYWSALLLSLRLIPGKDRRTKILALKTRNKRPKKVRRKSRSASPKKNKSSPIKRPPIGLDAGNSVESVESVISVDSKDSMGSGGSMSSGASFDFRVHSLQKAKRTARSALIYAHEVKVLKDQEINHGAIVYSLSNIKLAGIVCHVDVRYKMGSPNVFFHVKDEYLKDYYLHSTIEKCNKKLKQLSSVESQTTLEGDKAQFNNAFELYVKRLLWLEQASATERRAKVLTINRPRAKVSKVDHSRLKKIRSLSPNKLRTRSIKIIPAKEPKKPLYSASMGTVEYAKEKELIRKRSSLELTHYEEEKHLKMAIDYGPIVMTRDVKMAGFNCKCEIRNIDGSNNIFFHIKDELHKEYFLNTSKEECLKKLQSNGWYKKLNLDVEELELFDLLPLFAKHLLWLEQKSETERRAKILTLNRKGPLKKRVSHKKSSRSMSPVPRKMKDEIDDKTTEAAMRAKRELRQAEIRAHEHEAIRQRANNFGPILYEKTMKLNQIICAVQVRYQASSNNILFHAIDDQLTEYELPSTIAGCLTTMQVRGKKLSKSEFEVKQLIEFFVRYLLWLEPVEGERRRKRLTLNRPKRKELRVSLTKQTMLSDKPPPSPAGTKRVIKRLDKADTMRYTAARRKSSLPKLLSKSSTLLDKKSLIHCLRTIRHITYEVSVFGSGPISMYRLFFLAKDEERDRTYQLNVSLDRAVSALTDSEAATLLADNYDFLKTELNNFADIKTIYTSVDALRLYVDCLDIVRDNGSHYDGMPGGSNNTGGMKLVFKSEKK